MTAGLTVAAIEARIAFHEIEAAELRRILRTERGCKACVHRTGTLGSIGCGLAAGEAPPTTVQAAGCQAWAYDYIPF